MTPFQKLRSSLRLMTREIHGWMRERRMVIALEELDDATLKDIGVYRGEIQSIARQHCR